jgi:heme A synthase
MMRLYHSADWGRAEGFVCFSASANFAGSAVLGAIGVATIAEVKHRRELLFAAMPGLFALHQFTEGFVWLGLDHKLPPVVVHDAGAAAVVSVVIYFFFRRSRPVRPVNYSLEAAI